MDIEAAKPLAKQLLDRFKGYGAHVQAAAEADVYEIRALCSFVSGCESYSWGVMAERRLFTVLAILRIAVDDSIPAPEPLRRFARWLLSPQALLGIDEIADCWEPLQELWCIFNQGQVCSRTSTLHEVGDVGSPLRPFKTPPPFVFESSFHGPCYGLGPPMTDSKPNPDCSCKMPGSGDNASCWNLFDLVDRLTLAEHFMVCPVQNLGWNLRKAVMKLEHPEKHLRVIEEAYSQVRVWLAPQYASQDWFSPPPSMLRVGDVKLLIQGLRHSPFLRELLLSRPPLSPLPLHFALSETSLHARLWLIRCDLPVHYNGTLTYADIGTWREFWLPDAREAREIRMSERGPSLLEHTLRHETLYCYMENEWRDARVRNLRPHEYKIPEEIYKKNERMWNALTRLAHPTLVFAAAPPPTLSLRDPVQQLSAIYAGSFGVETREKKNWLCQGELESYKTGYPSLVAFVQNPGPPPALPALVLPAPSCQKKPASGAPAVPSFQTPASLPSPGKPASGAPAVPSYLQTPVPRKPASGAPAVPSYQTPASLPSPRKPAPPEPAPPGLETSFELPGTEAGFRSDMFWRVTAPIC